MNVNAFLPRRITEALKNDLSRKMILLSGPRQCGKTTLSKSLLSSYEYLNFDIDEDRLKILKKAWSSEVDLLVLDEIHKMRLWKRWLKGVYDGHPQHLEILVTGSAKMDIAKKMGDSLAGRHFNYRLYPFDLSELKWASQRASLEDLFDYGNYPEPYLEKSREFSAKWRRSHQDLIVRQDLVSFEAVRDISSIETLILLLRERVGSPISYASLARDLQRDDSTIKRWLTLLENLYIVFKVPPHSKNIARAILKESKYYFYDTSMPIGDSSKKLENLIAFSLLKRCHFLEDCLGKTANLRYLKSKDQVEVDFLLQIEGEPDQLIEVKWSDPNLSPQLFHFKKYFPNGKLIQLSNLLKRQLIEYEHGTVFRAQEWLEDL